MAQNSLSAPMRRWLPRAFFTLLLALLLALPCAAGEQGRTVRIGYIDYAGFIARQDDGSYTGYGVQYLREIAKYTGWNYEYVYDTWPNQLAALKAGKIDFLCHAQKTPAREQDYLFGRYSDGSESSLLYVRSGDDRYYYEDTAHFDGMTVAFLADSFQNDVFAAYAAANGFTYTARFFDTDALAFAALDEGRVDAVAMGSLAGKSGYKVVSRYSSDPFYFMTGKANAALLAELDHAMGEILAVRPNFGADLYETYYGGADSATGLCLTRAEAEFVGATGEITVGLLPDRAPFSATGESGRPEGIVRDVMDLVARKSGLRFRYEMLAPGQTPAGYLAQRPEALLAGVAEGNATLASSAYLISDSFADSNVILVCRSGWQYGDNGHSSYTLAVLASSTALQSYVALSEPSYRINTYPTTEACLRAVLAGRADFAAQSIDIVTPLLQNPHYAGLTPLPNVFMPERLAVAELAGSGNKQLMNILDKSITSISGAELREITLRHTIANRYRLTLGDAVYRYRLPLAVIVLLLLVCAALVLRALLARQRYVRQIQLKNDALARAVAQAEGANRAKSNFLSRMSHEIRTPLNAIVGITAIARQHEQEPRKMDEYLNKIDGSSRILLSIINDILDMSAIESNKIRFNDAEFDMKEILTGLSGMYYTQCRAKGVQFTLSSDLQDELLIGDSLRVNQILLNILSNAFKFTDAGGAITVTVRQLARREDGRTVVQFVVADTGCGMTPEMQARLFLPFEQESATTALLHGGSGLGMSIAKNLIDRMDGTIGVDSEKGRGTTVTVELPFPATGRAAVPAPRELGSLRALAVDDDAAARDYIAIVLGRIGVPYDTAASGREALAKVQEARSEGSPYDICFIDWKMPDMNGISLIKQLRQQPGRLMIAMVSAYDRSEAEAAALQAGADLFVTKPLFQSTIFNALVQLCGGRLRAAKPARGAHDLAGAHILLAEDNELNRAIAVELLEMANARVDCAANGREAVDKFVRSLPGRYNAVLMDIQMPEMDGYAATRAIRASAHPQAREIPIFALTANAFAEDVRLARDAGMNGHIAKPIDTGVLYGTLETALHLQG